MCQINYDDDVVIAIFLFVSTLVVKAIKLACISGTTAWIQLKLNAGPAFKELTSRPSKIALTLF